MNLFKQLFKILTKKGQNSTIRLLSLSLGIAISAILLSVYDFNQKFDTFIPDNDRIYRMGAQYSRPNSDSFDRYMVPGGWATYAKAHLPEIEYITRFTYVGGQFFTTDKNQNTLYASFCCVDSSFFDIFDCPLILGDAKKTLSAQGRVLVSERIAQNIGENPVGQIIRLNSGEQLIIDGIFKSFPNNSHLSFDILVSLPTISRFTYDGSENMIGNDRYYCYMKIRKDTDSSLLTRKLEESIENSEMMKGYREENITLKFLLRPLREIHTSFDNVKTSQRLYLLLSIMIFITIALNYLLMIFSTLIEKSKEIAAYRCYGANSYNLAFMALKENLLYIVVSTIFAILLSLLAQSLIEELINLSFSDIFQVTKGIPAILIVLALTFAVTAPIVIVYIRIPITAAFRSQTDTKHLWKSIFIFLQFFVIAFLSMSILTITSQYKTILNTDVGYDYNKVVYANIASFEPQKRNLILQKVKQLPFITDQTLASEVAIWGSSGNNVYPSDKSHTFNVADQYMIEENFYDFMKIPVTMGGTPLSKNRKEVMISESFVKKMINIKEWSEETNPIGQTITMTQHNDVTVCGVYKDYIIGTLETYRYNTRPSVSFIQKDFHPHILYVRMSEISPENLESLIQTIKEIDPTKTVHAYSLEDRITQIYSDLLNLRKMLIILGIILLILVLCGLIGYINNEINRRHKELAIRVINGATYMDLALLFIKNIYKFVFCAITLGIATSLFIGIEWKQQFIVQASTNYILAIAIYLGVLLIISIITLYRIIRVNHSDPIKYLRES